jgi:hypothetical protein
MDQYNDGNISVQLSLTTYAQQSVMKGPLAVIRKSLLFLLHLRISFCFMPLLYNLLNNKQVESTNTSADVPTDLTVNRN